MSKASKKYLMVQGIKKAPNGPGFLGRGAGKQTDTHTHINTKIRPGLGSGPSENGGKCDHVLDSPSPTVTKYM